MNRFLSISFLSLSIAIPSIVSAELPVSGSSVEPLEWRFKVYLDDKEIGWHSFLVSTENSLVNVVTEAQFNVKFLFITAYRYQHRNVEQWDSKGLVSIDAYTNANGDEYIVRGEREGEHFRLTTGDESAKLPPELKSFCYWSPEILTASRLLNSQTGEYETVEIIERGATRVAFRGEGIPAVQYDIMVQDLPISIWYCQEDNRWLALESLTESGRVLRYEPVELPVGSHVNRNLLAVLD